MKKVSIIIPCYNQEKFISKTVESALHQTYKNIEILCINDASTDKCLEILREFADKYKNVSLIDLKQNQGVIYARDYAIKMSTGDYILPLDGDDIIDKTYVEKAVNILDNNSDIGIVYSNAKYIGKKRKVINVPEYSKELLLYKNYIYTTAMYRKLDYLKTKGYSPRMNNGGESWDLWLSFIELGLEAYKIDEVLFFYRIHNQTRMKIAEKKKSEIRMQIFKNHYNIYLKSDKFIPEAFNKSNLKYLKYKKIQGLLLILFSLSVLLNIVLLLLFFLR